MPRNRILIVDDSPANLKLAQVILVDEGYDVRTAGDAAEALESIRGSRPDLILMDIQLPEMDGLELTRRLKADPSTAGIVVVALTAYAMKGDDEKARAAGCDGYLTKPFDTRTLARTIAGYLEAAPPTPVEGPRVVEYAGEIDVTIGRGRRVLVVDDEALNRRLTEARLSLAGFAVTVASAPEEALSLARADPPDAIVSDILMPGMDGYQLCLTVRADPRIAHLPVILVSASYFEEADRHLATGVGANALVVRTPDLSGVVEALAEVLQLGAPPPVPRDSASLESAYRERLVWQIGRQLQLNADLAQKSALHSAALAVIGGLGQIMARPAERTGILTRALIHCLDGMGVSTGLLYLADEAGRLRLHEESRVASGFRASADQLFGHPELFEEIASGGQPVAFDGSATRAEAREVLSRLGQSSLLFVPLGLSARDPGVLVFASQVVSFADPAWLSFAQALASQVGQAVALGETLSMLAASEARYRSIFEDAFEGFCRTTPEGRYLDANPALARILGYSSPRELIESVTDIRSQVYVEGSTRDDYLRELQEKGYVIGFETAFRRKDGTTAWLRSSLRAKRGPTGEIVHIDGMVEDITERRAYQQRLAVESLVTRALAESEGLEAALPRLLEGLGTALGWDVVEFFVRDSGHLRWIDAWSGSPRARPFVEASRTLILASGVGLPGRVWAASESEWVEHLTTDGLFRRGGAAVDAGLATGAAFPIRLQGEVLGVLALFSHQPRPPDADLIAMFEGIGSQIGQFIRRRRVEEAHQRQARILENLHDAVSVTDVTGHIIDWNHGAERLYGYTRREVLGRRNDFLSAASSTVPPEEIMTRVVSEGRWSGEIPFVRKDGTGGFIDLLVLPLLDTNGKLVATFGVARDITERRLLEEQFRQAQKMEAIGRLAGGVAHDFNNILTAILGYSDLLASRLTDPTALREVDEIRTAGERAAGLTRQLLAFSRKQVVVLKVLDLNAVATGMNSMLRRLIGEDVALITRLSPSLGRVEADPGQIEQVILNLAVNARDAMPRGGRLTIETANVDLDEAYCQEHLGATPGRHVLLAMSDTGTGMDPATREKAFEPFFTTKGPGLGTGLGLSTVYGIVKQARGHIWIYSEPGHGTSFKIYLPRVDKAVTAVPSKAARVRGGTEHILLVEDEDSLRRLVRVMLEKAGYRVTEAVNGHDALERLRKGEAPDLLLSDTVMPGPGALEILRALRELCPTARVIMMSGYTDEAVLRHGILESGTPFLQKPFASDTLLRKVREVLDGAA